MPHLIIVKVQWMEKYEGEEHVERPWGEWVKAGNPPGERFNFKKQKDGKHYAHINAGGNLNLRKLNDDARGALDNATVAFVAPRPNGSGFQDCVLVGYYTNATIYSEGVTLPGVDHDYFQLRASSENATLFTPNSRTFGYKYRSKSKVFTYGDIEKYADDELLLDFINSNATETFHQQDGDGSNNLTAEEWRRLRYAARYERYSSVKLRNLKITNDEDIKCEACKIKYLPGSHEATRSFFEVHHKAPVNMMKDNEVRPVTADDLAVLCANCHRAVHATKDMKYIGDIAAFRRDILGL